MTNYPEPISLMLFNQAIHQQQSGDLKSAYALYLAAVRADSRMAEAWNNLGCLLILEKKWTAAIACFRKAVALRPDSHVFQMGLGDALFKAFRIPEAREYLFKAVQLEPNLLVGWYELAVAGLTTGNYVQGLQACERALAIDSEHHETRWIRALCLLASQDFEQGFAAYECRLDKKVGPEPLRVELPKVACPKWNGENLKGKKILILPEQGYGDVIQFSRFLRLLPLEGVAEILLSVPGNLKRLFEDSFTDLPMRYILHGEPLENVNADFYFPLLSLPSRWRGFPNEPYLKAPSSGPKLFRSPGTRLAVGICWSGNPKHEHDTRRSAQLEDMFAELAIPGIELYSLQVGLEAQDPTLLGPLGLIHDLGKDIRDFADTAFVVEQLDCVVSVDTAVAHLTGGLGKKCHLLVSQIPDWRWGAKDSTSVWYPSIQIHRQQSGEDWRPVLRRIAATL